MKHSMVDWRDVQGEALLAKRYVGEYRGEDFWPLGDVIDVASGLYVRKYVSEGTDGSVPYIRVDNVRAFLPNLTVGDVEHVVADDVPGFERVSVRKGDVVIARTATLGRAFVVDESLDGAVMSQHITRLRVNEAFRDRLHPHVLAAYLNDEAGKDAVMSRASGSTRLELTHDDLRSVPIPMALVGIRLPPGFGDEIERLFRHMRNGMKAAHRKCGDFVGTPPSDERYLSSLVPFSVDEFEESLLPRFHDPAWPRLKSELTGRFRCVRLGDLAEVKRGAGTLSKEYQTSGIPYLRTSSLVNFGIDVFPDQYGDEETYAAHGQLLGEGDVLVSIEGKIGQVAMLGSGERALIKNHIEYVRLRDSTVSAAFLTAWLGSWPAQVQFRRYTVVQSTIPGIGAAARDILIPVAQQGRRQDEYQAGLKEIEEHVRSAVAGRVQVRAAFERLQSQLSEALAG
jgi:type I restriction enzyme S subunit